MKNILHLIETSGPGGAEKMLISLVEHLNKEKYKSTICLLKDGWLNSKLKERGLETIIIPQNRSLDFMWLLQLIKVLKERDIHLMHAHEFAMNTYGSLTSLITKIPIVTTVHGKNYYHEKWRRRWAYRFASRQSKMVVVSENIKKFLINNVGIKNGDLLTIYNGTNINLHQAKNELRDRIKMELRIDKDQPVIGTVGNLYPVKGHTYLLNAAAIVKRTFPTAIFLIAGRGQLLPQLQEEAKELSIKDNVRFLGFREDIPLLLQAMDIFVLPSISEGLPLAALEAMANEKPVIATDVGGIPEVVIDGTSGFLVPSKTPEVLAEKILLLLANRDLSLRLGKEGRVRVEKEFSLKKMIRKYEKLYDRNN